MSKIAIKKKTGILARLSLASRFIVCLVAVNLVGIAVTTVLTERYVRNSLHSVAEDGWARATSQLATAVAGAIRWKKAEVIAERYAYLVKDESNPVGRVLTVNNEGERLASFALPGIDLAPVDAAAAEMLATKPTTTVSREIDGYYLVVAPSQDAESKKQMGHVALAWRTDGLGALAVSVGAQLVLIQIATILVIAGVIFAVMRAWVTKPLGAITERVDALVAGNLDVEIAHQDRNDETGVIARALETFRQTSIAKLAADRKAEEHQRLIDDERASGEQSREATAQRQAYVVDQLRLGLAEVAKGNLTVQLAPNFPAEYRQLGDDYNEAVAQLKHTLTSIKQSGEGIRWNSEEIRQSAGDLAQRTERQAANLEETVAALDQITTSVTRTAQNTGQARSVVTAAKSEAETSRNVVHQTIGAMGQIEQSSSQINQIIGVIDEIAFQTNLLALNAGVEAARAGEAGRGFAVVASEVRTLAQRSAEAAREIKTLISAAGTHVERGVSMVGETGKVLERIIGHVTEINEVVNDIASSAQEQATALQSVNTTMNAMDQVTQQNASMAKAMTSSSASLATETGGLVGLIQHFHVGETFDATPPRRAAAIPAAAVDKPKPHRAARAAAETARVQTVGALALKADQPAELEDWTEF